MANNEEERGKYDDIFFSDIFEFKLRDNSVVRGCFAERKSTRQILSLVFSYGIGAELVEATLEEAKVLKIGTYIWHFRSREAIRSKVGRGTSFNLKTGFVNEQGWNSY